MKKKALGRGLEALIPETGMANETEIDLDRITRNPDQPRLVIDTQKLEELSASIKAHGVLQPILVRPFGAGYQLIAGERRLAAAQRAGLMKIPAAVRDVPDDRLLELALIENIQREQLNPIEEAQAYHNLAETLRVTQEELSARLGKERSTIANSMRLLKLPPSVKSLVSEGKLSPGHARALLSANASPAELSRTASLIVEKGWSVRETEKWAKGRTRTRRAAKPQDPNEEAAADRLRLLLGTKVEILSRDNGAGEIRIHFYNEQDLDRVYSILTANRHSDGARS